MVVDRLEELVGFNTVSSRPVAPLASWLAERCEHAGLQVELVHDPEQPGKHNVIATAGPHGTDGLMVSGHMDVVPTEGQPWTTDPFLLTRRDGRLYGRGTADMKGFIAATLCALERVDLSRLRRELILAWTYDEEVGCLGSATLSDTWLRAGRRVPRACLIGEPTSFRVLRMHAGHTAVRITVHGSAAHSSRPDLGVNAIEGAATAIFAVQDLARELQAEARSDLPEVERPWVALNIGRIEGGAAVNVVPDRCCFEVGFRPLPGENDTAVLGRLRKRIGALPGPFIYEVERLHSIASLLSPAHTSLERHLLPCADSPDVGAAGFATDGGNLAGLGTAPLVFGPGRIEVAHKADEWVGEGDLHRTVDIVERLIHERCG